MSRTQSIESPQDAKARADGGAYDPRRVMRVAILGATGSVGRELVTQALAAGHEVTALVREEPRPGGLDGRVALLTGDALDPGAVARLVEGSDAVVSALGHAKGGPEDLLARTSANLVAAMHAAGVERLVVLSSPAVEDAEDRPGLVYRAARVLLRLVMPSVVRDHRAQARVVEASGLEWTIVRGPLLFTDGPHTGRYTIGPIRRGSRLRISRADLADSLLAVAAGDGFAGRKPLVCEERS
jgi:putative NADH-flavin reductase